MSAPLCPDHVCSRSTTIVRVLLSVAYLGSQYRASTTSVPAAGLSQIRLNRCLCQSRFGLRPVRVIQKLLYSDSTVFTLTADSRSQRERPPAGRHVVPVPTCRVVLFNWDFCVSRPGCFDFRNKSGFIGIRDCAIGSSYPQFLHGCSLFSCIV